MQSKNKGQVCKTDNDCPSSRTGQYSNCRCGFNFNGSKYCDTEGGDNEWVLARTAVLHDSKASVVQNLY